MVQIGFGLHCS